MSRSERALGALALALTVCACGSSSTGSSHGTGGSGGADAGNDAGLVTTAQVDLLLMVDNSLSMGDKQELLSEALPRLMQRMTSPTSGTPVTDMHVGVISSSLGGHGANQCEAGAAYYNPTQNDRGHLLPSVRSGLDSYKALSFLWWDPSGAHGGETSLASLLTSFTAEVGAVGEKGCGYEASLEAWYRFLVDPAPPYQMVLDGNVAKREGVDAVVLTERKDFLRPGSAVVIVMLTDENDCSIVDGGYNWIAAQTQNGDGSAAHLPRATSACGKNPDDPCCVSCAAASVPAGCPGVASDPECLKGNWDDVGDHPNLRCWQEKRRFGVEFLYPTRRYVEALTQPRICPDWEATGPVGCTLETRVQNPLFAGGRDPSLVFLAGIVGVPWQDLASDATLADPVSLELLGASELESKHRFDWLVPKCDQLVASSDLPNPRSVCSHWSASDEPDDPFMIESSKPRTGKNPATGDALAGGGNAINGHEWFTEESDLEYACIFALKKPRDCAGQKSCDCADVTTGYAGANPVCQSPNGTYSTTQYFAKAYPAQRQLEVLHDLADRAVVASICPKSTADPSSSAYGFNAAMDAVVGVLAPVLAAN